MAENNDHLPEPEVIEGITPGHEVKIDVQQHKPGRSIRMDTLTWALILIWAGAVMLTDNFGYLTILLSRINLRFAEVPWHLPVSSEVWTVFFLGLGVLLLLGVLVRLLVPAFRYDVLGNVILSIVAVAVALGRAELIWPLILIAVGVSIILWKAG